jgi:hypothetical protein
VPAMKLTPNAAMRARDVSRPRAEHLAEAEAAEASTPGDTRARTASGGAAKGNTRREGQGRDIPGRDIPGRDIPGRDGQGRDGQGRGIPGRDGSRRAGRREPGADREAGGEAGREVPGRTTKGGTDAEVPAGDDRSGRPGFPRRRRGQRDAGRRGRPSR